MRSLHKLIAFCLLSLGVALNLSAAEYYLVGTFNTWSLTSHPLTYNSSDNTYSCEVTLNSPANSSTSETQYFKIVKKENGVNKYFGSGNSVGAATIKPGASGAVQMWMGVQDIGKNNDVKIEAVGKFTFTFNANTNKASLSDPVPVQKFPDALYMHLSTFSGPPNPLTNIVAEAISDGVYQFEIETDKAGVTFYISKSNGVGWNEFNGLNENFNGVNTVNSILVEELVPKSFDLSFFVFPQATTLQKAGKWKFEINLNTKKMNVQWANPAPATPVITVDPTTNLASISTTTTGALIYYNLDSASAPTVASTPYQTPIDVPLEGVTIKAIAVKNGYTSGVAELRAEHAPIAAPVMTYNSKTNIVEMTTTSVHASIFYLKEEPQEGMEFTPYSKGINVPTEGLNLYAIARCEHGGESAVTHKTFAFHVPAPTITINKDTGVVTIESHYDGPATLTYTQDGKQVKTQDKTVSFTLQNSQTVTAFIQINESPYSLSETVSASWKNPLDVPTLYFLNGAANWNLNKPKQFTYNPVTELYTAIMTFPDDKPEGTDKDYWRRFKIAVNSDSKDWINSTLSETERWQLFEQQSKVTANGKLDGMGLEQSLVAPGQTVKDIVVSKKGTWTVTVSKDFSTIKATMVALQNDVTRDQWNLEDMNPGQSRYFYLSREQNDSRVSPEWELLSQKDGSFAIKNFMVIPAGQFIIRQITRNSKSATINDDEFSVTDWGFDASASTDGLTSYQINDLALGIPAQANESTYTAEYTPTPLGSNKTTTRGYFWNVGYTMASVAFKPAEISVVKPIIENGGRPVIYYRAADNGTKFNVPAVYTWKDGYKNQDGGKPMENAGNGFFYYALTAEDIGCQMIIKEASNWNGQLGKGAPVPTTSTIYFHSTTGFDYATYPGIVTETSKPKLTMSVDFTQPSTLNAAPKQGFPYVAILGEYFSAPKGDDQADLNYIANINADKSNNAPNNTGFTNGYIYYNENARPVVYGKYVDTRKGKRNGVATNLYYLRGAEANMNSYGNGGATASDLTYGIAPNKAIYSTRQPSVYPLQFYGVLNGQQMILGSDKTELKYMGTETQTFETADGKTKPIKVAVYKTTGVPLMGRVKLFTGHGGSKYGATYNGLSMHTNWGYGTEGADGGYTGRTIPSGVDVPLSGGGARHINSKKDETTRGETVTTVNTSDYNQEDNNAGAYAQFNERTYVSELLFFCALETDEKDDWHSVKANTIPERNTMDAAYVDRVTNAARNYSWMRFSYTKAPLRIELSRAGLDALKINYGINDGEEQTEDEYIDSYRIFLTEIENNKEGTHKRIVWESGLLSGSPTTFTLTGERLQEELPNGWYQAVIVGNFKRPESAPDSKPEERYERSVRIHIYSNPKNPNLDASQIINVDESKQTKEYTFDVLLKSDLNDYIKANVDTTDDSDSFEASASETRVVMQLPVEPGQQIFYKYPYMKDFALVVEGSRGFAYDDATKNWKFTTGSQTFFSDTITALPLIKLTNAIPGNSYSYTLHGWRVKGTTAVTNNSTTAKVTIVAPAAKLSGTAIFTANWDKEGYDGYTSVSVPQGQLQLIEGTPGYTASIAPTTLENFKLGYDLYVKTSATSYHQLGDNIEAPSQKVNITNLPYIPQPTEIGHEASTQAYAIRTDAVYNRKADNKTGRIVGADNAIGVSELNLIAPRQNLSDKSGKSKGKVVDASEFNINPTSKEASDYIRITAKWEEKWGGANMQVEDALVLAEINQPTAGAVYRIDATKQKITHHTKSIFSPAKLYQSNVKGVISNKAPGYSINTENQFWAANRIQTKKQHQGIHPNFVERVGEPFTVNYEGVNNGTYVVTEDNFNDSDFSIWAGSPIDQKDAPIMSIPGAPDWKMTVTYHDATGKPYIFEKWDAARGYYDNRNAHTRAGWQGGEYFSRDWFAQAVASSTSNNNNNINSFLENVPSTVRDHANDIIETISKYIAPGSGLPKTDAKLNTNADPAKFGRDLYLKAVKADPASGSDHTNNGRIMLKVNHVNHESWYGNDRDVMEQWKGAEFYNRTFAEKLHAIRVSADKYTPVMYSFEYEYPVLASYDYASAVATTALKAGVTLHEAAQRNARMLGVNADDVKTVTARSTGAFVFDGANTAMNQVPTAVDDIASEISSESRMEIAYDAFAEEVSVVSATPLASLQVVNIQGRVVHLDATRDIARKTDATVNLSNLDKGAYVIQATDIKGNKKTLKMLK